MLDHSAAPPTTIDAATHRVRRDVSTAGTACRGKGIVTGERRLRILARLGAPEDAGDATRRLGELSVEVTGTTGAGIMLMSGDVTYASLWTTDGLCAVLEELHYTLGEGPALDAHDDGHAVLVPDLAGDVRARWPGFTGAALDVGARAVFGLPLRVGAARIGALILYRDRPGSLNLDEHADGLVIADIIAHAVLVLQANGPTHGLSTELEAGADYRDVVHQAAGMVAVQLNVSVARALIRLRAHAFANDQPLTDVATNVVARVLRLEPDEEV